MNISLKSLLLETYIEESYETDMETIDLARNIYDKIVNKIKNNNPSNWSKWKEISNQDMFARYIKIQISEDVITPLDVFVRMSYRKIDMGGSYTHNKNSLELYFKIPEILNVHSKGKEAKNNLLEKIERNRDVLVHEITHYLDHERGDLESLPNTNDLYKVKGYSAYLNNPVEYNAHYLQFIESVEEKIDMLLDISGIDDLFEFEFSDYKTFFKKMKNMIDKSTWIDKLTEKWRKKFHRRFYKYYDNKKEKLKEKYME